MAKTTNPLRIRRSISELQAAYEKGDKKPLEDLMRAWKGVKELPYDDPRSFFMLGGYHGEPFRGPGTTDSAYWGGYCNHGNVLFPTWHRVYLYALEQALQSIEGCQDVMLPYWDETDEDSLKNGIPWALTAENFELDGVSIPNPLRSFVFPVAIVDNVSGDNGLYSKPQGYETVRYPLSGLVGTPEAQQQTAEHNSQYPDYNQNVATLNSNVVNWLVNPYYVNSDGQKIAAGVLELYKNCLRAPNYTVFSNTTSAAEWNKNATTPAELVTPLESPHNDIHLSVGGFDVPGQGNASAIAGANGDMGENDTAGLDPIFFFHHCNVDRVFWLWQKQNGHTDALDIIPFYPGTNSTDSQGPTPGFPPNTILDLDSPLYPFTKIENGKKVTYTSNDCINIEKQLGFTYSKGSLEEQQQEQLKLSAENGSSKIVHISGINRAQVKGSFVVAAFANINGKKELIGYQTVLSRWNVRRCANCQTHIEVKASFGLNRFADAAVNDASFHVEFQTRDQSLSGENRNMLKASATDATNEPLEYNLEVR